MKISHLVVRKARITENTGFISVFSAELRVRQERCEDPFLGANVHLNEDGGLQLSLGQAEPGGAFGGDIRATRATGMSLGRSLL